MGFPQTLACSNVQSQGKHIQAIIHTKNHNMLRQMRSTSHQEKLHMLMEHNSKYTTKWVEGTQLFQTYNIALNHNLFLLHKFIQNNQENNSIVAYNYCINPIPIPRSKIHPILTEVPNLTLSIKECNPDKEIIASKPTIQIHGLEFNQTRANITTI